MSDIVRPIRAHGTDRSARRARKHRVKRVAKPRRTVTDQHKTIKFLCDNCLYTTTNKLYAHREQAAA